MVGLWMALALATPEDLSANGVTLHAWSEVERAVGWDGWPDYSR